MGSGGRYTLESKQEAVRLLKSGQGIEAVTEFQLRLPWQETSSRRIRELC
jgi:hypothetical protein